MVIFHSFLVNVYRRVGTLGPHGPIADVLFQRARAPYVKHLQFGNHFQDPQDLPIMQQNSDVNVLFRGGSTSYQSVVSKCSQCWLHLIVGSHEMLEDPQLDFNLPKFLFK